MAGRVFEHGLSLTARLIVHGSVVSFSYFIQSHLSAFLPRQHFSERRREGNTAFFSGPNQWVLRTERQESPGGKSHAEMSHVEAKHVGFSGVMPSASKLDSLGTIYANTHTH